MNIEQRFIESNEDDQELELNTLEQQFDAEHIQEQLMTQANKRAQKILRKNKREINRLKNHAGKCLLENNFYGYSYAIKKLRDFYKQPYNDELIKTMWDTSRQALLKMVEEHS